MNIQFNAANLCTPKKLAAQLIVDAAKILNHEQRQALVDIFKTLDQAEKSTPDTQLFHKNTHSTLKTTPQEFIYQDEYAQNEFNQEYWSGHHCDSYTQQDYPEDWVKRTQQRPRHHFSNTTY